MVSFNDFELNRTTITASAAQTEFTYTFYTPPEIVSSEIKLNINGADSTDFTVNLTTKVLTLDTAATVDDKIVIYRRLDKKFSSGFSVTSTINSATLEAQIGRLLAVHQDLVYQDSRFTMVFPLRVGFNDTFTLLLESYNQFTIDEVNHISSSGTIDFTLKRNGTDITDLTDITVTSTKARITPTATTTINAGDLLEITTLLNDDALDLIINLKLTKVI